MRVLFSIHPVYAAMIVSGEKRYELRRKAPARQEATHFAVYSTAPVGGVVAEGRIGSVLSLSPEELWGVVSTSCGLDKNDYDKYFQGCSVANAIELCDISAFERAVPLSAYAPKLKRPPQSFSYLG